MVGDGFLHRYFLNNADKRLHKWVHYFDIYERHFDRFRGKSPTMIEIGVAGGGSLAMWKEYFGPGARIIGIDVDPKCKQHERDGVEIFIGSQADTKLLDRIVEKYGNIDIVLDDGSHHMTMLIATFEHLYPKISPTGVYLAEDLHCCYRDHWAGGVRREGTFMELMKLKIDELHAVYTQGEIPISDFTRSTDSICVYDSIVVLEKRPQGRRQAPITQPMSPTDTW